MKFFLKIIFMNISLSLVKAGLSVSKAVVRVPKENDIGLIFDICVTNSKESMPRERLQFSIRPAEACTLELGNNCFMKDAGHIVGGYFGCIEPGATETVSLIWPTISLYNRVGCCPIVITSTNSKEQQFHLQETLSFDTTFEAVDPQGTCKRKSKNFRDCQNYDLEYLDECKPVNCEERYFGIRNFLNACNLRCEPVPRCEGGVLYDPFTNECVDAHYAVSKRDIQDIKQGYYKSYDEWKKEIAHNSVNKYVRQSKRQNADVEYDELREGNNNNTRDSAAMRYTWLQGMIDGLLLILAILLLQVFATIGIYVIICFIIFLVVSCLSRNNNNSLRNSLSFTEIPAVSDKGIPVNSRLSLYSRR